MLALKAKIRKKENIFVTLKDEKGKKKRMFEFNILGKCLHKYFNISMHIPIITGKYTYKLNVSNLITNAGLAAAAARIYDNSVVDPFTYLALGTDNTAADVTDTALGAEVTTLGGERAVATISRVTTDTTNDTTQWSHTWNFTGTLSLVEIGIFNDASAGDMLARSVFPAINVLTGYALAFNWLIDND